jgi:hypothetical protein
LPRQGGLTLHRKSDALEVTKSTQPANTDRITMNVPPGWRREIERAIGVLALLEDEGDQPSDFTAYMIAAAREKMARDLERFRALGGELPSKK